MRKRLAHIYVAGARAGVALVYRAGAGAGMCHTGGRCYRSRAGGRWHAWRWCGAGVRVPSGPIGPTRTTTAWRAGARFDAGGDGSHLRISPPAPAPTPRVPYRLALQNALGPLPACVTLCKCYIPARVPYPGTHTATCSPIPLGTPTGCELRGLVWYPTPAGLGDAM